MFFDPEVVRYRKDFLLESRDGNASQMRLG